MPPFLVFEIFSLRASASGFVVLTPALCYFVFGLFRISGGISVFRAFDVFEGLKIFPKFGIWGTGERAWLLPLLTLASAFMSEQ